MYYGEPLYPMNRINITRINITRINFLLDKGAIRFYKNLQKLQFSSQPQVEKNCFLAIMGSRKTPGILEEENMHMKHLKFFLMSLKPVLFHCVLYNYLLEIEKPHFPVFLYQKKNFKMK
jgi:hypothetical protein